MLSQYPPYIVPIIALCISGTLAFWGWKHRPAPGAAWFSMLMLAAFVFTLFYSFEIFSQSLKAAIFWSQMQYFGALNISIMWLFLTLTYTSKRDRLTKRTITLFFVIPIITLILVWTNQYHELIWSNPRLEKHFVFSILTFDPGPWWWVNIIYGNILLIISTFLLVKSLKQANSIYRRQILTLLLFLGVNWVGTAFYVTGKTPYNVNPTPLTVALGGAIISWGLFRYQFTKIIPIAKDIIFNEMKEGLIVLSEGNRIVDINPLAREILGEKTETESELIGKPIKEALFAYPDLREKFCLSKEFKEQRIETTLHTENSGTRSFEIRTSQLKDKQNRAIGRLMFWHDITARAKQEETNKLLLSVTQEVSTAQDFKTSLNKTLSIIVKRANWTFGEAWVPNHKRTLLINANVSYYLGEKMDKLKEFDQISQDFTFPPNVGLPGRVWASKKIEWQKNTSTLPRQVYLRVQYAQKAELRASLGIPVLDGEKVVAVLVFYMNEIRSKDPYAIDLISAATAQLGAVLQHKSAEEIMRIQSTALEASSNGIVIANKDGKVTWTNPAFSQMTGYSRQEVTEKGLNLLKSGKHSTAFYANLWNTILSGKTWHGEIINKRKNGSVYTEEQTITPTRNKEGEITHFIAIKNDITQRKANEEKMRQLSRAVEQSGSTIVITDLEGNIIFTNPAFSKITGYSFQEAIGKNTKILNSGRHNTEFYRNLWDTISSGNVWQGEMINRKKNGELYWEAATISPVQNEKGETTHYLAIKEDISERKAIEKALIKEQEKTDALLKNILPEKVVREIKETGKAKPVLLESISILFTDFKNFTSTAEELSPDELVKLIDYYFTSFDQIVEKHHLEKLKTIGDSYMCASGLPDPDPEHATNITNAALDMLNFVNVAKTERRKKGLAYWDIRIGISSGSVVAGVVGKKKYAYDIWGDAVVMAARMEQSGEVNKINISQSTYDIIKNDFICQYRGKVAAKHKGQVNMYFVEGKRPRRA
jgi:PAS domain S-box-containing protein